MRQCPTQGDNPDPEAFENEMEAIHDSNFNKILQNMRISLSMINYISGNLRTPFHIGTFALNRYKPPGPITNIFSLAEFRAMIGQDQFQGRAVPRLKIGTGELLNRLRGTDDLLEPIDQARPLRELEFVEPTHSATIDFPRRPNSDYRLEIYLKRITYAGEVEIKAHRWFKARSVYDKTLRMPLQLAMVDLSRTDWQCTIEFFEIADEWQLPTALTDLASSIRFTSTGESHHFISKTAMNITIPKESGARVVQKSAVEFKIKGTNLILELARFNEYNEYTRTTFSKSIFSATIYDLDWDSLLGGDIDPSGTTMQQRGAGLEAFFPSTGEGMHRKRAT